MKIAPTIETAGAIMEGSLSYYKDTDFSADMQMLCQQITEDAQNQTEVSSIDENTILYEVDNRFLNPEKPLPATRTWAKIGDRPALTCTGIVLINAKPKQGKSYSIYALLSALIRNEKFDSLQPLATPNRFILFDTEMAEVDLQTRIRPLYKAVGDENRAKFQVCPLLKVPKHERLNVITDIVEQYDPQIIAIDQVADLMEDFNSSSEAVAVFERLKVLMAERTVFLVIHQNKAKDNNSKGHAGTLAEQDASEVYTIKKEKGIFELSLKMSRFASSDDATPFRFSLSKAGEIISCDDIAEHNKMEMREDFCKNFARLFGDDTELSRTHLVQRIIEMEGLQERAAHEKITKAHSIGSLDREQRGRNAIYRLLPF